MADFRDTKGRLQHPVESNLMGVIEFDAERILVADDYFLGLVGRSRAELERGELKWRALSAPDSAPQDDEFAQLLHSGNCVSVEKEFRRPDGIRVTVLLRCVQVVATPDWRATGIVVDLTEHKQRESVEAERRRLETVRTLAAGLAHSLNNLLTTVIGNAGLLLEFRSVADTQRLRELVTEIIFTGDQASGLAARLLAYSGQGRFLVSRADLGQLIREQVNRVEAALPPSCRFRAQLPDDLPSPLGH